MNRWETVEVEITAEDALTESRECWEPAVCSLLNGPRRYVKEIAWFCLSLVFHNVRHTLHAGNMIVFHRVVWPAAEPDTKQGGTAVRRTVLEWTEYFCSFRDFFYVIGNSDRIPYYTKGTTCRWCTLARRCSLSQTTALGARMCKAHSYL